MRLRPRLAAAMERTTPHTHPRRRFAGLLAAAAVAAGAAPPALAWDDAGHQAVAAIAWEEMRPETRRRAAELLAAAPPGAGLAELAPAHLPRPERSRRHFLLAATWPDRVEDGPHDRPTWHWINRFWKEGAGGPVDLPPPAPQPEENVLERLGALSRVLADERLPADRRAVALAWLLHLVGDVHQPLHTSGRITSHPDERRGDRGGNTFELHREPGRDEPIDLHAFWDRLLTTSLPRRPGEPRAAWIDRAAADLARRHPRSTLGDLAPGDHDRWVDEGLATAQSTVYRHGLRRGERPPEEYREAAWGAAAPAMVKAGHRLAALLDEALR